jgi:FKBP-type peptidyl-prolyl cis-trans isomerase 2
MFNCAQAGNRISVHYIGTLDNGYIFDSRDEETPMQITLGNNEIFPALEQEIIGMRLGDVKNIQIKAADAYGPRLQENIIKVDREQFPRGQELKVGKKINLTFADDTSKAMLIIKVEEETVTLDGNHQLAGLDLTFALKLVKILS